MNIPFENKVALVIGAGDSQILCGDGSCRFLAMQPCRKFCDQPALVVDGGYTAR